MESNYFASMATQLGAPLWILILAIIWSAVWKIIALWKSARNNHLAWFIVIVIFNTLGVLPILYIFVFSKMKKQTKQIRKKPKRKKN